MIQTEDTEAILVAGSTVRLTGIEWDIDEDDIEAGVDLPDSVDLVLPSDWDEDSEIADLLSDKHGYCIRAIGKTEKV